MKRRAELIVDPQSRVIEPKGEGRNSLGSNHVGVHRVSVYPHDNPNVRYTYNGLIVGPCVHVAPYTDKEEFVFVREQRPLADTKGTDVQEFLGFPGGFAEGPRPSVQAARELEEEAGITTFSALIPLRQGVTPGPSFHPYPQLSDERSSEFLAIGAVLPDEETFETLRQEGEGTETHIELVTMSIPQIERVLLGQEAAVAPFSGPAISTFCMAQLAVRNL